MTGPLRNYRCVGHVVFVGSGLGHFCDLYCYISLGRFGAVILACGVIDIDERPF